MSKRARRTDVLAQVFRVMGEPTRLRIWCELQAGEMNVTELCDKVKAPQPTVSHHLGIMRMSGLLANRRSGKEVFYWANDLTKNSVGVALRRLLNGSACVRIGPLVFALAKA